MSKILNEFILITLQNNLGKEMNEEMEWNLLMNLKLISG